MNVQTADIDEYLLEQSGVCTSNLNEVTSKIDDALEPVENLARALSAAAIEDTETISAEQAWQLTHFAKALRRDADEFLIALDKIERAAEDLYMATQTRSR